MSDEEYRECIEKLIDGGRTWDAMYELQGYARNYINNMEMAVREVKAERLNYCPNCGARMDGGKE